MTPAEKVAKDACDYLFRVGRHIDAKVEFDPVGYLRRRIDEAVAAEREACAKLCEAEADTTQGSEIAKWGDHYAAIIRNRRE